MSSSDDGETLAGLKARLRCAAEGANRVHGVQNCIPGFVEAMEALPSTDLLMQQPQEVRALVEGELKRLGIAVAASPSRRARK
jgi:hypothetical protein